MEQKRKLKNIGDDDIDDNIDDETRKKRDFNFINKDEIIKYEDKRSVYK